MNVPDPSTVGEDATPQPQQKPRRNVTMEDVPVQVERAEHVIQGVPSTAEAVDRRHLETLRNEAAQMDTLRASVKRKKHAGSPLSKRLLASALESVPGFSLKPQVVLCKASGGQPLDSVIVDLSPMCMGSEMTDNF
jgi:hypothetical protein